MKTKNFKISRKALEQHLEAGTSITAIAALYGVSFGRIKRAIAAHEIEYTPKRGAPCKLPDNIELLQHFTWCDNVSAVARFYGVTPSAIYQRLRPQGIRFRRGMWYSPLQQQMAPHLFPDVKREAA